MLGISSLLVAALASPALGQNFSRTYGSSDVHWSKCDVLSDRLFECAIVHVPMDHWAKTPSIKTFSVPMMRLMSNKSNAETILMNPGGPGGSGIDYVLQYGLALDTILGGNFHLLGFDPRGVAGSSPAAKCIPDGQNVPSGEKVDLGPLVPSEDYTLTVAANSGDFYAALTNYAKVCNETIGEHLSYMNTPQTAADMNAILDSIGQKKLNYYGGSYGTTLGTTYAQLFPERVGRVVLDGVVNYSTYWDRFASPDTISADDCWEQMLQHCLDERSTCPLADGFTNVTSLRAALEAKINALDVDPVSVYFNVSGYGILRGQDIRSTGIFERLYTPSRWPYLIRSLAYLLQDDYEKPYLHLFGGDMPANPRKTRVKSLSAFDGSEATSPDALNIINLGDRVPADQLTHKLTRKQVADDYVPGAGYIAQDTGISETFLGATWLLPRSHNLVPAKHIETANPVLIMSNIYDPVTPLKAARVVNNILQGSVLLVQDAIGHTTLAKASKCTSGHMKKYFVEGVMPAAGTICQVDDPTYFPDPDLAESKLKSPSTELDHALHKLEKFAEQNAQRQFRRF